MNQVSFTKSSLEFKGIEKESSKDSNVHSYSITVQTQQTQYDFEVCYGINCKLKDARTKKNEEDEYTQPFSLNLIFYSLVAVVVVFLFLICFYIRSKNILIRETKEQTDDLLRESGMEVAMSK